jgi:hypothetical protein
VRAATAVLVVVAWQHRAQRQVGQAHQAKVSQAVRVRVLTWQRAAAAVLVPSVLTALHLLAATAVVAFRQASAVRQRHEQVAAAVALNQAQRVRAVRVAVVLPTEHRERRTQAQVAAVFTPTKRQVRVARVS